MDRILVFDSFEFQLFIPMEDRIYAVITKDGTIPKPIIISRYGLVKYFNRLTSM
jgi:hypothetical protein